MLCVTYDREYLSQKVTGHVRVLGTAPKRLHPQVRVLVTKPATAGHYRLVVTLTNVVLHDVLVFQASRLNKMSLELTLTRCSRNSTKRSELLRNKWMKSSGLARSTLGAVEPSNIPFICLAEGLQWINVETMTDWGLEFSLASGSVVSFSVEMISVLSKHVHQSLCIILLAFSNPATQQTTAVIPYRDIVEILLEEQGELRLEVLLRELKYPVVSPKDVESSPLHKNCLHLLDGGGEHEELVLDIQHRHHVLVPLSRLAERKDQDCNPYLVVDVVMVLDERDMFLSSLATITSNVEEDNTACRRNIEVQELSSRPERQPCDRDTPVLEYLLLVGTFPTHIAWTATTSEEDNGAIVEAHCHEVEVFMDTQCCGRGWLVVGDGSGDSDTGGVTMLVLLLQVPHLNQRVHAGLVFLEVTSSNSSMKTKRRDRIIGCSGIPFSSKQTSTEHFANLFDCAGASFVFSVNSVKEAALTVFRMFFMNK
uniref:Uncharacterized protein n=1 Tax=Timema cristinae TaxID=61476 RepID=A0A7R9CTT7_TIMCR|nr:unnamed protein product [Timema cristinae]